MSLSKENINISNSIIEFEQRIEEIHVEFSKYYQGAEQKVPKWEELERDLINFSRKKIYDLGLSKNLDRVLYKFQNRKKIWLQWLEESHHISQKEP